MQLLDQDHLPSRLHEGVQVDRREGESGGDGKVYRERAIGYRARVISYQLSVISSRKSHFGDAPSAAVTDTELSVEQLITDN